MRTLTINADTYQLPAQWNELTAAQLLTVSKLSLQQLPVYAFKVRCFLAFLNFTVDRRPAARLRSDAPGVPPREYFYIRSGSRIVYMLTAEDIAFCSNATDFLFSKTLSSPEGVSVTGYTLKSRLYRNLLPIINVAGQNYYGPDDGLVNCIYQEYIHTEEAFAQFSRTRKESYLDKLIAVLYRPELSGYDPADHTASGDRRQPLADHLIEPRAKLFAKLDPVVRQAIILWYDGCKAMLAHKYPLIFETKPAKSGIKTKVSVFESHLKIIDALAQHDVTKNEAIRHTYLHEVLLTLNQLRQQQIDMEAAIKSRAK